MNRTIILILCLIAHTCTSVFSQADVSMVTHWNNRANYNPASIVKPGYLYLFSNIQNQWVGYAGAPKVINMQASVYSDNLNSAIGVSVVADKNGLTQAFNPTLLYAYCISTESTMLSFGLSGGVFWRTFNNSGYEAESDIDPLLIYKFSPSLAPDANIGVEFQSRYIVAGLSTTHVFSLFNESSDYLNTNHRYGYLIYKNTDSDLLNYYFGLHMINRNGLVITEGNTGLRFKNPNGLIKGPAELFDIGFSYRSTRQMAAFLGIMITPDIRIGYAYEHNFRTYLRAFDTHELMLEYRIPVREFNCKTCRNNDYWYF